jgi:hypothetical protein
VAAGVNAEPLVAYTGGIVRDKKVWNMMINHIVSIVGWGMDEEAGGTRFRCVFGFHGKMIVGAACPFFSHTRDP